MKPLYPYIKHNHQLMLEVSSEHSIYVEESGSADGIPVLFIHGGPGLGTTPEDRRFFDPSLYRIILFDQRGCGNSAPFAHLHHNTTQDLLSDIEKIRQHFNIQKWVIFGGSWGATLGLLYAQAYPQTVLGLILRGIFLARESDLRWFYQYGASLIFPEVWEAFILPIPEEERGNLIEAYYRRLTGKDELARMHSAKYWSQWEAQCATLHPCKKVFEKLSTPHTALSLALLETYYFMHRCFIEENQILREAYKLEGITGTIVHGRYDAICPLENAWALHQAWPSSELDVIRDAGHASSEPGIVDALITATDQLARQLS